MARMRTTNDLDLDLDQIWKMVGDDPEAFHSVLTVFRSGLPESKALLHALHNHKDGDALAREAHSMKGFAMTLGAATALELALRLEIAAQSANWDAVAGLVAKLSEEVDAILVRLDQIKPEAGHGQNSDR